MNSRFPALDKDDLDAFSRTRARGPKFSRRLAQLTTAASCQDGK